jgi:hypothetical protein
MLFELLTSTLGGGAVGEMSRQLGSDEQKTNRAVESAVPLLLGALTKNSSSSSGAESLLGALTKDHDGSVLDNVGGFLRQGGSSDGDGILGHLLGTRRPAVESAVSQSSGLDSASVARLLTMLAPIVMGALGKTQRSGNLDAGGIFDLLKGEMKTAQSKGGVDLGMLSMLDADGDGSVVDDIAKLGGGLLGSLFK